MTLTPEQRARIGHIIRRPDSSACPAEDTQAVAALLTAHDALAARVAQLEGIVLASAGNDPAVFAHLPITMPADRTEQIAKAIAADDSCISAGNPKDALAAENRALREALADVRQKLSPVLPMDEWMVGRIDDALRAKLAEAAPYTCPECGPHVKVDEDECCAACGRDAALTATRPPEAPEAARCEHLSVLQGRCKLARGHDGPHVGSWDIEGEAPKGGPR